MVEQLKQLTQHDPRRIGPFEVLGRLGAGGMGLVYLARSASGRRVAIKTVRTELAEDQLFRVRFTREVEAARAVSGFYTAAVVDADPRAAVPWLATAYVPAPSLEEIVNECGPLPAQAVRWLAAGIAEALQSIHGAGLVHRDLKPSNVLVVEDGPRVIDFGIASGVSNTRLTMTNVAVGTPAYMSPEQARDSRSVTGASDVFSLGSTLVFAATGHAPFHGANPVETVFMLLREGPDLAGLPDELRPLMESCMQMEAGQRPSPADLQSQLAPHLFGSGSDDSGTASAWLPPGAVGLIEGRRGGRTAVPGNGQRAASGRGASRPAPAAPPAPPVSPPMPAAQPAQARRPESAPAAAESGWPGQIGAGPGAHRGGDPRGAHPGPMPQAAVLGPDASTARVTPVSAPPPTAAPSPAAALSSAPPAPSAAPGEGAAGPVQLGGSPAPIGPGPRADAPPPRGQAGAATNWVRPPGAGPTTGVPPQGPAHGGESPARNEAAPPPPPEAPPAEAGRWRPWRFRMSNDVWGTPAVADDLLYVTSFEVHALDVASGRRKFKTRDVAWAMAVADGRIHASDGPSLYALDPADGRDRWRIATEARQSTEPVLVAHGAVHLGSGKALYTLDAVTGTPRWRFQAGAEVVGAPVVAEGRVHFGSADHCLYTLDAMGGQLRWKLETGGEITGSPVAVGGVVYACSKDRCVYALDAAKGTGLARRS
ncbi:protein kinase domain-containing protein [Streptomyces sp. NEAU-L66]|uniref:protein kinase domain-containing protein n=1 Tax=Streptomyces sp. NEAU-L66 TaxID=3390812 RepID=UPI0039C5D603